MENDHSLLNKLSTFQLAFNLATGKYTDEEKVEVLQIIKLREVTKNIPAGDNKKRGLEKKPPRKGSKAEKIKLLLDEGNNVREVYQILKKEKVYKVYYPEIYRVIKLYCSKRPDTI